MRLKRFISLAISFGILLYIYAQIDTVKLGQIWQDCDRQMLAISLGMVIPITLITSWRLQQLIPQSSLGIIEANRLILGASVLNMVLPSKMGDIAKAYFMSERSNIRGSLALAISVFEKACDLLSLLLWCVFGLVLYPEKDQLFWFMTTIVGAGLISGMLLLGSEKFANLFFLITQRLASKSLRQKLIKMQSAWTEMHNYFWSTPRQLLLIIFTSIFIWLLHLWQIWLFILALNATVPFIINLALSPLSILAGLIPLTFAGIGTRDAALIYFYQDYFTSVTGAALGILCTSRYFIPALIGLPFLGQMLSGIQRNKQDQRI